MILTDLEKLTALVKVAAKQELLTDFGHSEFEYKDDGSVLTPADIAMQNRLEKELKFHWPEYDLVAEEMPAHEQLAVTQESKAYWCIDPLDGTSNYAANIPFFAVSIALIIEEQQQLGLIYDPIRDEMFTALKDQGAYLNGQLINDPLKQTASQLKRLKNKPVVAEIDLKRLPEELAVRLVTESIFASQRNIGSSAIDWCWMAAGRFDVYLHGGQKMWDYAAGSLIFSEAGGHSVSLDDEPVFRGKLEDRSVLASNDINLFNYWYQWMEIKAR